MARTRKRKAPQIPDNVTSDTMLRLAAAGALGFPEGSMSAGALRRQARAGRLAIYRIAGKDYTTLNDIEGMKTACRVHPRDHDLLSSKPKAEPPSGTSGTASAPSAQAALKATAQRLRKNLPSTSPASTTPRPAAAAVIPIKSR